MSRKHKPTSERPEKRDSLSFTHEDLRLGDLVTHPVVQREFQLHKAQEIAAEFDPDRFGEPYFNRCKGRRRTDVHEGTFDGQHRVAALKLLWPDEPHQLVYCRVYEGITDAQCATITEGVQRATRWTAVDQFLRLRLVRGETQALGIKDCLAQFGLRISHAPDEGAVRAVQSLDRIVARLGGFKTLDLVLRVLHDAYRTDTHAYHQTLLIGLAQFHHRYNGEIDRAWLVRKMAEQPRGPATLVGRARDTAKNRECTAPQAMSDTLVLIYNKGRRKGKLPSWF